MATDSKVALGLPILERIDSRVIQDLALSEEPDAAILGKYGFTSEEADRIVADPVVKEQVANLVTELRRSGNIAQIKARLAAEALIPRLFTKAQASHDIKEIREVFQALAKVGGLEPRSDGAGKVTGTIVRVDLNIGQLGFNPVRPAQQAVTVEVVEGVPRIDGSIASGFLGMKLDALEWSDE